VADDVGRGEAGRTAAGGGLVRPRGEADVDLAALAHNLAELRRLAAGRELIGVVKADAYGHGARAVGLALEAAGAPRLAVISVGEAAELRAAGVRVPILLLGGIESESDAAAVAELGLVAVVQHAAQLTPLAAAAARRGRPLEVQLEVDTGMSRMGVPAEAAAELCARIAGEPALRLDGLYTHLARADEADLAPTRAQLERFRGVLAELRERGIAPGRVHVANSAALLAGSALGDALPPELNAVRPGIALYGVRPAAHLAANLRPVLTLRGRLVNLRSVAPGQGVGYGGSWRARHGTRIATLALGYADGVPFSLANRGEMTLRGRRVPIVGRVSMDLVTLDVGEGPAELGDLVTVFGAGGPSVEEVAAWAGTIPWEILVRVGRRVARRSVGSAV
jgi:alanine racemase